MKTHRTWILALTTVVAITVGQAFSQSSLGPAFATFSQGGSVIQQASHHSCGACGGGGCGICGASSRGTLPSSASSSCGCSGGACGGGNCSVGCNTGSCLGSGLANHGLAMQHMQAMLAGNAGAFGGQGGGPVQNNGPFGGGGCCTPMWYDVHVEWMNLQREDAGERVDFTSRNAGGPIVLSTDNLDMDDANGFRATYAMVLGPATGIEVSYFGTHEWDSAASVSGNADLYSVFSNFGTEFFGGTQGFPGTVDEANFHSIAYSSELHSVEVNMRRRWVSSNCLFHGSYLAGVRYVSLQEHFNHFTAADSGGSLNYDVETINDAVGFQIGTDLFVCISPRFKVGAEVEAGVFGNDTAANTFVTGVDGNTPITPVSEAESEADVALVAEAGAIALFRVTPRWTIRGGYQVMYLDGMALAGENFNTESPLLPRTAFVDNGGDAFYHGATLGMTFLW